MRKLLLLISLFGCGIALAQTAPDDQKELASLQSSYDEANPVITSDGQTIFFSRKGHPRNIGKDDHYDIWVAFRQRPGHWGKPVNMAVPLNNRQDNFVVGTNANGQTLFLNDNYNLGNSGLVYTQKNGRIWDNPQPVHIEHFQKTTPISFSMATNGNVLLLAMDNPDANSGKDIFVSTKISDQLWSEPISLGPVINSGEDELHACLASDFKTLFFLRNDPSHNHPPQMMAANRIGNNWTDWTIPRSTGISLDTGHPAFSLDPEGTHFYCATASPKNDRSLSTVPIPPDSRPEWTTLISGTIMDVTTGYPLAGQVRLQSLNADGNDLQQSTDYEGSFQFVLPNRENFQLNAKVPGYFAQSETITDQPLQELDRQTDNDDQAMRSSPKLDQLQLQLQQLNRSIATLEQQRQSSPLAELPRTTSRLTPKGYHPQLDNLREKYYEATGLTPDQNDETSTGDPELDAMKRRFRKHNKVEENQDETRQFTRRKGESELEAMKRKYNEANDTSPDDEQSEETVVASSVETYRDFEAFVERSVLDLESEMSDRVVRELKADLLKDVAFKMNAEMEEPTRNQYADEFQRLVGNLETNYRKALRRQSRSQTKRELKGELIEVVEEELKASLRQEVKRELKQQLREEVKRELRIELEYLLTRQMADDVRSQIQSMIRQLEKEEVSAPAYYFSEEDLQARNVPSRKVGNRHLHLQLYPLETGQVIPLNNLFFEANSDRWKPESQIELDRLYELLTDHPNLEVEIGAHTNGWCSTGFANRLSDDRARAVAHYLTRQGIDQSRIQWKGYGKSQPLFPNDSVENCRKNQRLELKILSE